jgi:hypothetical protein
MCVVSSASFAGALFILWLRGGVVRNLFVMGNGARARTEFDPDHITNCNTKAKDGTDLLFHEAIPCSENGQGYLRVTRSSL